jgi:hypothetical protein
MPMRTIFLFLALCFTVSAAFAAPRRHQLPSYDIQRNCSREASDSGNVQITKEECIRDETDAKKQLDQQWSKLAASKAKSECLLESGIGGDQSYLELLTCLKMSSVWTGGDQTTVGQAPASSGQEH